MGAPITIDPVHILRRDRRSAQPLRRLSSLPDGATVQVHGYIASVRVVSSGRGQMAQVQLWDESGTMDGVCFANQYGALHDVLQPGRCVRIRGRRSRYRDQVQLMIFACDPI